MQLNYRSKCHAEKSVELTADFSLSRLIKKYITDLFAEKEVSPENSEKLWNFYDKKLSAGLAFGYPKDFELYDKDLVNSLATNIAEFSAFKEASFAKTLVNLLVEEDRLVPWNEFKEAAYLVDADYNVRYLQTEYDQTVANAQSAAKWQDFQNNTDLYPNLKYITVGDGRVRPEHEVLEGTIKPLDDPLWDAWYPPNDWGCRCSVEQTDEEVTGTVKGGEQLKLEFDNNPGKTGQIFGDSSYKDNLTEKEQEAVQKEVEKWIENK